MNLDPRTLLFSLILTCGLSVLGMFVAAAGRSGGRTRDGMGKWAAAMFLQTLTWGLVAARGTVPDLLSVIAANGLMVASYGLMLVAIHEFQQRQTPHWQYLAPVALILLISAALPDDIRGRFIWGGLIYAFQMVLIARALLSDRMTRAGRAWRLLFGGVVMVILVLGLRGAVALSGHIDFAQPQNTAALQPIQLVTFIAAMSIALLGSIGFVLMVKERTDREVMLLAMTDSLTQIPNRRALKDYAEHALARRSGLPLALLMIDVDHFKVINDTHGHQTGDEVLSRVPALLAGRLRGHDFLGRYGGEEFCVIAPDTDTAGALALAEALRETVAATVLDTESGKISVSVSIGISCCPASGTRELKVVLAEADAALYDAKQSGRNRVVCFAREMA